MNRTAWILIQIILAAVIVSGDDVKSKVVKTKQGSVRGYKDPKYNLYAFYEIPYATAPTGPDRYKAPLPAPVWLQTRDTTRQNIVCPQSVAPEYKEDIKTEENCLVANVFVPDTEEVNLPVVVYVHGGAYLHGNGLLLTHEDLVQKGDIIIVNFNYRLGIHGFLCLGTEDIPGNAGMKDQVALLRWVKNNIANFGGNPDDVTIAGYSAGSSAVEHLLLSEMTRGLFQKVILESGSALNVWSVQLDPIEAAKLGARALGFISDDIYELEEFYKKTPIDELAASTAIYMNRTDSQFVFSPCIERNVGTEMFLKESPLEILQKGNFPTGPMLVGFANMEGIMRLPNYNDWHETMNTKFSEYLPADLKFENEIEIAKVAMKIKQFYFGDKGVNDDTKQAYVDYFSDVLFRTGIIKALRLNFEAGNENIYLYEYSFPDHVLLTARPDQKISGASHCAQSGALGESQWFPQISSERYDRMRSIVKQLWISFIKTGKPVPYATPDFPEGWPAVSADASPYMILNLPCELKREPLIQENTRFWEEIYLKYYRKPIAPPTPPPRHSEL